MMGLNNLFSVEDPAAAPTHDEGSERSNQMSDSSANNVMSSPRKHRSPRPRHGAGTPSSRRSPKPSAAKAGVMQSVIGSLPFTGGAHAPPEQSMTGHLEDIEAFCQVMKRQDTGQRIALISDQVKAKQNKSSKKKSSRSALS